MKTNGGWHVIRLRYSEKTQEKWYGNRLGGQVGNGHFNHVKFSEEKGRYISGLLGGGTVQRHKERRGHGTS